MTDPLIPIYGSFGIHAYGVAILSGLMIALWWASNHPWWKRRATPEQFIDVASYGVLIGIIGGRMLYVISEWHNFDSFSDIFRIWEGGFSIWGTVISLLIFLPTYAYINKLPLMLALDICGLYGLFVHGISRIGCWYAGCCGGIATHVPWALPDEYGIRVHPTQLYSALTLLVFFLLVKYVVSVIYRRPGQIIAWYMIAIALERFTTDWWRNDRILTQYSSLLSLHQLIALFIFSLGIMIIAYTTWLQSTPYEDPS